MTRISKCIVLLGSLFHAGLLCGQSIKPRGVSPELSPFYDANKNFQCLNGNSVIPFHRVNDDYCDCEDGSDEPGTSACSNGRFYCANLDYIPLLIPSSRVNDGICDCCDGSDEWNAITPCTDTCLEVGHAAREEKKRLRLIAEKGLKIKDVMASEGTTLKNAKQEEIALKETQKEDAQRIKDEREVLKINAETEEKAALEVYEAEERRLKELKDEEDRRVEEEKIRAVFTLLDIDKDQRLTVEELKTDIRFDVNDDGDVSDEEISFYMSDQAETGYDLESFIATGWTLMEPRLNPRADVIEPTPSEPETIPHYDDEGEGDEEAEDFSDEEDEEELDSRPEPSQPEVVSTESKYDEETQRLINVAQNARDEFNQAKRRVDDLDREISNLRKELQIEYGPRNEFLPLLKRCFEYTDQEYVYKLCVFDYCTQRSKNGGAETKLGNWESWNGNGFAEMKYQQGAQCWNGPQRSTLVKVSCGVENKITAVSEPNKCEYEFHFETPAACRVLNDDEFNRSHDEL